MSSAEEAAYNPGDLVLVEPAERGMPPYPAFVVAPSGKPTLWPTLMTSVTAAQRPGLTYYWVDTDRLELVQRAEQ